MMASVWTTLLPFTTDTDDNNDTDDDVTSNATIPVTTPGTRVTDPPQGNDVAIITGVTMGSAVLVLGIVIFIVRRIRRKKLETKSSYEEGRQAKDANVAADSTYEGLLPKAPTDDETYSHLNDFDPSDGVSQQPPRPRNSSKQKGMAKSDKVKNLVKMYETKKDGNDKNTVDTVDDNTVYQNVPIEKKKKKRRFTLSQKPKSSASPVALVKYSSRDNGTGDEQLTEPITEDVYANAEQVFDPKPPLTKMESAEIYVNTPFP